MCTKFALPLLAIVLCVLPRAQAGEGSWPNRPVPDFGVIFNEDGDNNFPTTDQEYNRRVLHDSVDSMLGSGVGTHARCIGAGSDVLYYPTKVASTIGWREVEKESPTVKNARLGLAAGIDPLRIVGDRCKELGLHFLPSVRMNDAHFARTAEEHQLTGKFWLDNRDLALPSNRLDFSHEKVRKYRLDEIFEALDRYGDVSSGVELDFNRHSMFFPAGQEREKAHLLTDMVAAVRERLDQLEKQHGHPFYLLVRVWPTIALNREAGMDLDDWMRRRLIDVVVPTQLYNTGYDMPLGETVALGKETGCKVYPTVYIRTQYTWPFVAEPTEASYASTPSTVPTTELIAGLAENYAMMKVNGFEMYNYHLPLGALGQAHARVLATPGALTLSSRTYAITPAHGGDWKHDPRNKDVKPTDPRWSTLKQLPVDLARNAPTKLTMLVGQELEGRVAPDVAALRLGLIGVTDKTELRIVLNGQTLHSGAVKPVATRVTGGAGLKIDMPPYVALPEHFVQVRIKDPAAIKRGDNELTIEYTDGSAQRLQLLEVQLGLIYQPRSKRSI